MLNMSDEQLGKMAKDQENFQLESQRMIPPLVYPRSVPMIPLPIPFVQNPCQNPVSMYLTTVKDHCVWTACLELLFGVNVKVHISHQKSFVRICSFKDLGSFI